MLTLRRIHTYLVEKCDIHVAKLYIQLSYMCIVCSAVGHRIPSMEQERKVARSFLTRTRVSVTPTGPWATDTHPRTVIKRISARNRLVRFLLRRRVY